MNYMRKETYIIRILIIIVGLYFAVMSYKIIRSGLRKAKYRRGQSMSVEEHYTSLNPKVYNKKMTKLELRERLGRSTWTLLHTMAASYPGIPSANHKRDLLKFITLLSRLYPCGDCAEHFQKLLASSPPQLGNHDEFSLWLCNAHNMVNKRLGKQVVDCANIDELWDCGCEV